MSQRFLTPGLCLIICLSAMSIDITIPALPAIAVGLNVENGSAQLVISAYFFGFMLSQIPLGFASEHFGRKPPLYLGFSLYIAGGILAVFANSLAILLIGRFIQGIGGSAGSVLARSIARDISEGSELGKLMAILTSSLAIVTLAGPIVGSVLVRFFPWQSVFVFTISIGVISLLFAAFILPETKPEHTSETTNIPFKRHLAIFLNHKPALYGALIILLLFSAYSCIMASFSGVAFDQFQISPANIGWVLAIFTSSYLLGASINRKFTNAKTEPLLLKIGFTGLGLSTLLCLATLALGNFPIILLVPAILLFMVSKGALFGIATASVLRGLPQIAGSASGILGTFQIIGAISGTLLGALFYSGDATTALIIVATTSSIACILYWFKSHQF